MGIQLPSQPHLSSFQHCRACNQFLLAVSPFGTHCSSTTMAFIVVVLLSKFLSLLVLGSWYQRLALSDRSLGVGHLLLGVERLVLVFIVVTSNLLSATFFCQCLCSFASSLLLCLLSNQFYSLCILFWCVLPLMLVGTLVLLFVNMSCLRQHCFMVL